MKKYHRYLEQQLKKDLQTKMVLLGGPRQVGKTTLAQQLLHTTQSNSSGYLNWDIAKHRQRILQHEWPPTQLWVFDEIHKYRQWRNLLKGLYDEHKNHKQILVTGSAQLAYYRFGGDSLQGRYHYLHLHPLSVAELKITQPQELQELLLLGGFPEPFFGGSKVESKRWSREYRTRLIQDDIRTLERVQDLGQLELLMIRLPDLVGSPLSINALREDLQVSHKTVSNWLAILERLYAVFRVSPFGAPQIRAVKKEQKHYHFDWTVVTDEAARFENMVGNHLLKWVHYQQDVYGEDMKLQYFRDTDRREVDFVITQNDKPIQAIECKLQDRPVSQHLRYFKHRFPDCAAWQLSLRGQKDYESDDEIRVAPALTFLTQLI